MSYKKIVKMEKHIDYPISLNYRSGWGEWEAVREFVTNAIDSGGKVTMEQEGRDVLVINDNGSGMELHHLLIGEGESDGVKTIGKFHEGMKVAIVTLLRLGHDIDIRSNGLTLKPSITEMFGKKVLRISYKEEAEHYEGTKVVIYGITRNFSKRVRTFDTGNRTSELLLDSPGELYIKGIFVRRIESLFGYDLDMERANPNTGEPDWYAVKAKVGALLATTKSRKAIGEVAKYIKSGKSWHHLLEFGSNVHVLGDCQRIWRKVFRFVFGERVARYTNADSAKLIAYENKGIVLSDLPYIVQSALPLDVEVRKAPKEGLRKEPKVRRKDLEDDSRKNLRKVKRLFQRVFDVKIKVIVKDLDGSLGRAKFRSWIALNPSVLKTQESCFATFLHEFVHWHDGCDDLTEDFMRAESRYAAKVFYARKSRVRKSKIEA